VRLQEQIVALLKEQAGSDGFIVLGGTTEVVSALSKQTEAFGDRRLERVSMSLDHTLAQVKSHMEEAASEITRRVQTRLLDQVVDAARSGGKGCLGIQATKEALREARVDTLLMSRTLMQRDPDLADHFVGAAFEQGALVEELSEDGATRLDAAGEGVAARLRYTT
jgi:peptide subunit release factor 1 (eRF1)